MRLFRFLLPALVLLGFAASAQAGFFKPKVEICNPTTIFLRREDAKWEPPQPPDGYVVEIFRVSDPTPEEPQGIPVSLGTAEALPVGRNSVSLRCVLPSPLPANAALRVIVRTQGKAVAVSDFSTRPQATLQRSGAESEMKQTFDIRSPTPLTAMPGGFNRDLTLVEVERKKLFRVNVNGKAEEVPEILRSHGVELKKEIKPAVCDGSDTNRSLAVYLPSGDRLKSGSAALRLVGLKDLFGNDIQAEMDLTLLPAPKGKDDAAFFAKLLFESANSSADTLSLDLKAQPSIQLRGSWLFRPELTASVSRNVPQATSSIRLAALFSRTDLFEDKPLVSSTFSFGPSIEADRSFDRVNGLLDLRWKPGVASLYLPREKRRLVAATGLEKRPEEILLPLAGWGLEGWIGIEAGGSLSQQTVGALALDRYDILRLRPTIHGFYEVGPITLDVSSSLRYLFSDELTYRVNPDRTLSLREVNGFRPYTEATLSFAFDPAKHLSLAATYKNGSEPPLFVKVKKVSIGVVTKY
jgi:hypothetical protein